MLFSRKVKVTFVDEGTGAVLGTTEMKPEQLPESFLIDTTLDLGDRRWSVRKAEPPTREQYAKTRQLVLTLAPLRLAELDPREILFSLPTINDRLPDEEGTADGSELVLAEDDWRQIELVHGSQSEVVQEELRDIRRIHAEHRRGIGFDQVHVRSRILHPLAEANLTADALLELALPPPSLLRFDRHGTRIHGGFAHALGAGWILYGAKAGTGLEVLALHPATRSPQGESGPALEKLAHGHNLLLVDWCRCAVIEPGTGSFGETLGL